MRVVGLVAYIIQVPLKRPIHHASASRIDSQNILIRSELADGTVGWGEGVPRDYVTGETPNGALQQLANTPLADQLDQACNSWTDAIALCQSFQPVVETTSMRNNQSNALTCAVELSLLDAFGKYFREPLSNVVDHFPIAGAISEKKNSVRYSTTITADSVSKERSSAIKMRLYGFRQCKVKVGIQGQNDAARLARIRFWLGRSVDIRIDANEAWPAIEVREKLELLKKCGISCLEQPSPHHELEVMADLKSDWSVPIMLDESLTSMNDAAEAIRLKAADFFNIRLSKCGGFLNSLRIAAMAQQHGIKIQLGCHPGETGVLSAAGRHWAMKVRDIRYLEGSYDRHILRDLPTQEDITFGYGGRAPAITRPGLGVSIDESILDQITLAKSQWRWD
jgi:L-Ala-D/L-Glu epimerase